MNYEQQDDQQDAEGRFPIRVAARLSGIAAERIRSWETRHDAISPARSEKGTRRYSATDLERLRMLGRAVDAGHRIRDIAQLPDAALVELLGEGSAGDSYADSSLFTLAQEAIESLDAARVRSLFNERLDRMGTMSFARNDAMALAHEIGTRWEAGAMPISAEHMTTGILRSLLMDRLDAINRSDGIGPRILFATPSGERHDLGLLVASLVTANSGADVVFLGAEVPLEDLATAVEGSRADVLALGFVTGEPSEVADSLKILRRRIDKRVAIWVGGRGITGVESIPGVDRADNFDRLEAFVLEARGNSYKPNGEATAKGTELCELQ